VGVREEHGGVYREGGEGDSGDWAKTKRGVQTGGLYHGKERHDSFEDSLIVGVKGGVRDDEEGGYEHGD
jgi:hypothetical protein